jgi:hypothetical protein
MTRVTYFKSPWGKPLMVVSALASLLLCGIIVAGFIEGPGYGDSARWIWMLLMMGMPLCIFFGGLLFMIRGYELTNDALYVKRLLWRTKIDLYGLKSVDVNPKAMAKSLRTFGNGGLFSICGAFWNRSLGHYRAYATDPQNSVVLILKNKVAVITPQDPEKFAALLKELKQLKP